MTKLLAILQELGKALDIPKEKQDILTGIKTDDDVTDDLLQVFKDAHRTKLDVLSRNNTVALNKAKDDAFKAADRTVRTKLEDILKDKFNVTDSEAETTESLIDEIVTKLPKAGKASGTLTDDDVKKHTVYIQLERKAKKDLDDAKKAGETAAEKIKTDYENEKILGKVTAKSLEIFDGLKPVLSSDAAKAKSQRELVAELVAKGVGFQEVEGEFILLNPDGSAMEDEHHNKIKLEDHVKARTSNFFDFKVAEDRESPQGGAGGGNGGDGGGAGPKMTYTGKLPASKQEVVAMVSDDKIPLAHRLEIQAYADANSGKLPDAPATATT